MDSSIVPDGMVVVTEDEFFRRLAADPRDIMPNTEHPTFTYWRVVRDRSVWGWSSPGWKNSDDPKVYAVRAA